MPKPYYQDSHCTIYHGDCLEIMPQLEPVDLVLTDPPYGIKRDEGFGGFGGFGPPIARRQYQDKWDRERPSKETFELLLSKCKWAVIFGGNFFADLLPQGKHWIVWDKLNTMPTFGDCELIWTNLKRNSVKKLTREYNGLLGKEESRFHPTQKPLDVLKWCLKKCPYSDTILDPFMGSGTTLVAAKQLNRKAIGIEIEEKYCEIAVRRLAQEVFAF
jgi:DNA modification methylase